MKNMKLEWKRGDWAAYFGLMTNNLTNLLTMMGLLIFVVGIPKEIVYGRIAPAFGLAVLVASICYAWFGLQMARATGRTDVTALPSGPSAPSIFTVTFPSSCRSTSRPGMRISRFRSVWCGALWKQ